MEEEDVISICADLLDRGIIRRFGPSINHRELGYGANPMTVLKVPEDRMDEVGRLIASEPGVTHCYSRSGWEYNLFFMIHARTRDEGVARAKTIVERTGLNDYRHLFSLKEFKKVSFEIPKRTRKEVSQ